MEPRRTRRRPHRGRTAQAQSEWNRLQAGARLRWDQAKCAHPDVMILRPKARELIAGIADDPTFGPVIVFGSGGTAVEVISDKALALPPLDMKLARDLI